MDESPPTAAELGISEVEYERILRGLQQREIPTEPITAAPVRRRRPKWRLIVGAVALASWLLSHLLGTGSEPAYAFIDSVAGKPVTYSSCRPIQVAIYPAGGPPDGEALVRAAVDQMRSATGLNIVVIGAYGGYAPAWNFKSGALRPGDPISVSWQGGDAIDELTDHTAGLGGSAAVVSPHGTTYLSTGTIALSRDYYAELAEKQDHAEALAVILHEFGHVFGLDHVNASGELMYGDNIGRTTFGPGDLEGLRLAGKGPCV